MAGVATSGSFAPEADARKQEIEEQRGIQIELVDGDQLAAIIVEGGLRVVGFGTRTKGEPRAPYTATTTRQPTYRPSWHRALAEREQTVELLVDRSRKGGCSWRHLADGSRPT